MADAPADDKSKKKKRLDDLLSGLHAGKGNSVPEKKESPMDSLFRKATESATDLNKLQEMLGPLGGNPGDAKVCSYIMYPPPPFKRFQKPRNCFFYNRFFHKYFGVET